MTGQWPLQSFLEPGALPGAVPCARLHARQVLWEWGLTALSESTELLLSELVTNAVQVSRTMTQVTAVRTDPGPEDLTAAGASRAGICREPGFR
jgi:hypothetical protein